jgi:Mlc titration factor MtfA (ptsG expression regulator)
MRADSSQALPSTECHATWAGVMDEEREVLPAKLEYGVTTPLAPDTITNHADFFARIAETSFERPHMLRDECPRVYAQLAHFYEDGA